jgi:pimeloyl-ACP methyl ester carboxylesterase
MAKNTQAISINHSPMLRKYIYSEKSNSIYFEKIESVKKDANTAIIFLHGIAGSRRSWGKEYQELSATASLYFIDLLGHGFSAKPKIAYTLENHMKALHEFITSKVREERIVLVGHSLGAILALGYTATYPQRIVKTILLSLPYYHDEPEAKRYIATGSRFKFIFSDSLQTKIVCTFMCSLFGSVTRQIAPLLMRDLPREVAQDVHRHSYQSYISTLTNVLYQQSLHQLVNKTMGDTLVLLHGEQDQIVPLKNITELSQTYRIPLQLLQHGTHRFPLEESAFVTQAIKKITD